jgi:hypothetical protein
LQRPGSLELAAAIEAEVENMPTRSLELGIGKRSRLVERPAVPPLLQREVSALDKFFECQSFLRYACPHSTFIFHGVGFDGVGMRFEEKLLRERLDGVLADQKRIAGIIEERTNLEAAQVEPLFREARTKDADYAVGTGIVHEIKDVEIPPGSPVVGLVFQR